MSKTESQREEHIDYGFEDRAFEGRLDVPQNILRGAMDICEYQFNIPFDYSLLKKLTSLQTNRTQNQEIPRVWLSQNCDASRCIILQIEISSPMVPASQWLIIISIV